MPKLTTAILKNSILPASLMIVGKLGGLFIAVKLYGLNLYLANDIEKLFSIQVYFTDSHSALIANSISNITMLLLLLVGTLYLLFRYSVEVSAIRDPRTIVKLVKYNVLTWFTNRDNTFIKLLIWTLFLWAACLITIVSSINGTTYEYISTGAVVILFISTWGIIRSFDHESEQLKRERQFYL